MTGDEKRQRRLQYLREYSKKNAEKKQQAQSKRQKVLAFIQKYLKENNIDLYNTIIDKFEETSTCQASD